MPTDEARRIARDVHVADRTVVSGGGPTLTPSPREEKRAPTGVCRGRRRVRFPGAVLLLSYPPTRIDRRLASLRRPPLRWSGRAPRVGRWTSRSTFSSSWSGAGLWSGGTTSPAVTTWDYPRTMRCSSARRLGSSSGSPVRNHSSKSPISSSSSSAMSRVPALAAWTRRCFFAHRSRFCSSMGFGTAGSV